MGIRDRVKSLAKRLVDQQETQESFDTLFYFLNRFCKVSDLAAVAAEHGITKTALILVGDAIGRSGYEKSKLYDETFSTEFRKAKK